MGGPDVPAKKGMDPFPHKAERKKPRRGPERTGQV